MNYYKWQILQIVTRPAPKKGRNKVTTQVAKAASKRECNKQLILQRISTTKEAHYRIASKKVAKTRVPTAASNNFKFKFKAQAYQHVKSALHSNQATAMISHQTYILLDILSSDTHTMNTIIGDERHVPKHSMEEASSTNNAHITDITIDDEHQYVQENPMEEASLTNTKCITTNRRYSR